MHHFFKKKENGGDKNNEIKIKLLSLINNRQHKYYSFGRKKK